MIDLEDVAFDIIDPNDDPFGDKRQAAVVLLAKLCDNVRREDTAKIRALRIHRAEPHDRPSRTVQERQNAELHGLELAAMEIDPDAPKADCPICERSMPQHGLREHMAIVHSGRP